MRNEIEGAAKDLRTSETQSVQALTGKADLQQVVEAVTAAEMSLQKVTAVRDRVIAETQEHVSEESEDSLWGGRSRDFDWGD